MDWQPVWGVPRLSPCGSLDRLHPPHHPDEDNWRRRMDIRTEKSSVVFIRTQSPSTPGHMTEATASGGNCADCRQKYVLLHKVGGISSGFCWQCIYCVLCMWTVQRNKDIHCGKRCWHCIPQMSHFRYYQVHRLLHYWLIHGSRNQGSRLVSVTFGAVYTVLQIQANVCIMVLHSLLWIFLTWSVYYDLHPE